MDWDTGNTILNAHWKSMKYCAGTDNLEFCSGYKYAVENLVQTLTYSFLKWMSFQREHAVENLVRLFADAEDNIFLPMTQEKKNTKFYQNDDNEEMSSFTPNVKQNESANRYTKNNFQTSSNSLNGCSDVKMAVNKLLTNEDLIPDGSRTHILPTIHGKHQDLKSITPQTLADVIEGCYDDVITSYRIIDCRYPYEFEGGHIRGAENRYLHDTILDLLQQPSTGKSQIIIFHCEFSLERGPKMLRFLRSRDRDLNKENYPALNFPEIYLLDGGYKAFFNEHSTLCDPVSYRPMLHSEHSADLRHFRTKSKSWSAGEKHREARRAIRI